MNHSEISHHQGGTTYSGPDAVNLMRATVLASSIKMYVACGMIPTRGMTITKMLAIATEYTGKKYKRGQAEIAAADVKAWCNTMRAALPTTIDGVQV